MFLFKILCVSLLFEIYNCIKADKEYLDFDENEVSDYYEDYYDDAIETSDGASGNRIRRFEVKSPIVKVLSPDEIRGVRGALKQILAGIEPESSETPLTPQTAIETNIYPQNSRVNGTISSITSNSLQNDTTLYGNQNSSLFDTTTETDVEVSSLNIEDIDSKVIVTTIKQISTRTEIPISTYPTKIYESYEYKLTTEGHLKRTKNIKLKRTKKKNKSKTERSNPFSLEDNTELILRQDKTNRTEGQAQNTTEAVTDGTTTPTIPTKSRELDMPRLLSIIADLASDFETNLTRKLNETLYDMSIPTCTTPATEAPATSEYDANYTGVTVAKVRFNPKVFRQYNYSPEDVLKNYKNNYGIIIRECTFVYINEKRKV